MRWKTVYMRSTRSVSFGRDFHRSRYLISVSEAAYAALVDLLRVEISELTAKTASRFPGKSWADVLALSGPKWATSRPPNASTRC